MYIAGLNLTNVRTDAQGPEFRPGSLALNSDGQLYRYGRVSGGWGWASWDIETKQQSLFSRGTRILCLSDSMLVGGYANVASVTVTGYGTIATLTASTHGCTAGDPIFVAGFNDERFNGHFTVRSRIDANTLTYDTGVELPASSVGSQTGLVIKSRVRIRNWLQMLGASLMNPWEVPDVAALSGVQTTWLTDERLDKYVFSRQPDIVAFCMGTNDIYADATDVTVFNRIKAITDKILNYGISVFLHTIPPSGPSAPSYTIARTATLMRVNQMIRQYARRTKGVVLIDTFSLWVDPSSATADWRTDYSADDVHPSDTASVALTAYYKTLLTGLMPPSPPIACSFIDRVASDAANKQISSNNMMTGTGGTISGGATGTAPDTLTLTKTGTVAAAGTPGVSRSDGVGTDFQVVASGAVNGDVVDILWSSAHTYVAAGDELFAELDLRCSGMTNVRSVEFYIEIVADGVTKLIYAINNSGNNINIGSAYSGVFRTPIGKIPTDAASITVVRQRVKITFMGAGGATLLMGRAAMIKNPDA
jgi:lysophospholipase L1-like esterase